MKVSRTLLRVLARPAGPPAARYGAPPGPTGPPAARYGAPPRPTGPPAARYGAPLGPPGPPGVQARGRSFHGGAARFKIPAEFVRDEAKKDKSVVTHDLFEQVSQKVKTKATFNKVVDVFVGRDVRRRGHVEFIYAALKKMPEFGVERDLDVYNKLLDVFPKDVFVPRNFIQRMFNHYPRQQECGVQVLEQMENYGILPNVETKVLLVQVFGEKSHPVRKYQRLMYWFPRFRHVNPFPVPRDLPRDPLDLARLGLVRIADDRDAEVTVYQLPWTEGGAEVAPPHLVGIQSPDQRGLLSRHDVRRPVFVEGPFPLWLRSTCLHYYVLRADPVPPELRVDEPHDPERCLDYPLDLELELDRDISEEDTFDVDDLDEGPVFAMCMSSQGDQATLNQWISGLQRENPVLGRVPTLFRLQAAPRELGTGSDGDPVRRRPPEAPGERDGPAEEGEEPRRSRGTKR